jgi:hypothetical protein
MYYYNNYYISVILMKKHKFIAVSMLYMVFCSILYYIKRLPTKSLTLRTGAKYEEYVRMKSYQNLVVLSVFIMVFGLSGCPTDSTTEDKKGLIEGQIVIPGDSSIVVLAGGTAVGGEIPLSLPDGSVTLTTNTDYSEYRWYVDSGSTPKGSAASLTLKAAEYSIKLHSVTLVVKEDGVWYSSEPVQFRVTE